MNRVTQYAVDVLEGKYIVGEYVKLACQRHLDDIEKSKLAPYKFKFDEEKANDIIEFAETLQIAEGDDEERGPLVLEEFQAFILGSINGWVDKEKGYRRFRSAYVQVGRQNGKSLLNGVLAIYYSSFDGYRYPQIYCTATKAEQAKIVFNEVIKFINEDDDLLELFDIKEYDGLAISRITGGKIKVLSSDTKRIDGFRPYLGIVDEYHGHPNNQMYKLLEGGTGNLKQYLISVITTAGFDLNGPCYEMYEYCTKLLQGGYENNSRFVFIVQMDKDDDIWDPKNWVKANPLTCKDEEGANRMIDIASESRAKGGSDLRDFITKRLNHWYQSSDKDYIDVKEWKACACDLTLEDMRGKECVVGLDLSSGGDLTTLNLEFPLLVDEKDKEDEEKIITKKKYFIYSQSFMPAKRLAEHIQTDDAPYDVWKEEGLLILTETNEGIKTDYKYIIAHLKELEEKYDLTYKIIAYDPHNSATFLSDLEDEGWDTVEIVQSARSLNDATEDFELEVEAGNILYNRKNGLLTWSAINAKLTYNSMKECKIDKLSSTKRIDPIDAIIDSHKIAMTIDVEPTKREEYDENYFESIWG